MKCNRDRLGLAEGLRTQADFTHQFVQHHGLAVEPRVAGVRAGDEQEVVDQAGHLL
jgi:hypothetical protein